MFFVDSVPASATNYPQHNQIETPVSMVHTLLKEHPEQWVNVEETPGSPDLVMKLDLLALASGYRLNCKRSGTGDGALYVRYTTLRLEQREQP